MVTQPRPMLWRRHHPLPTSPCNLYTSMACKCKVCAVRCCFQPWQKMLSWTLHVNIGDRWQSEHTVHTCASMLPVSHYHVSISSLTPPRSDPISSMLLWVESMLLCAWLLAVPPIFNIRPHPIMQSLFFLSFLSWSWARHTVFKSFFK